VLSNPQDKPILAERTLLDRRLAIERKFARRLPIELIDKLKTVDKSAVKRTIAKVVADNCWGLWLVGMKHGRSHAIEELRLIGHKSAKFALVAENPPSRLRNKQAEKAIWARESKLAGNVAESEWERIQAALVENVQGETSRRDLLTAIDEVLGSKTFASRAETIARTELAHAYNTGRIETFVDNGVEAVRRYCIIDERTCPQCAGLNGMVANLNDWGEMARIYAPSHPRCRCTVSPLLNLRQLAEANRRPPPVQKELWMVERILKSVIGG
jgi:SPP1 gp7 family putative phage head morphogenesis protein